MCGADGEWTEPVYCPIVPTCCPNDPTDPGLRTTYDWDGATHEIYHEVKYTCIMDEDIMLTSTCQYDGTWSEIDLEDPVTGCPPVPTECSDPEPELEHASWTSVGAGADIDTEVTYTCDDDDEITRTATCTITGWEFLDGPDFCPVPGCDGAPPTVEDSANDYVHGEVAEYVPLDTVVEYICDIDDRNDQAPEVIRTSTCQADGTWTTENAFQCPVFLPGDLKALTVRWDDRPDPFKGPFKERPVAYFRSHDTYGTANYPSNANEFWKFPPVTGCVPKFYFIGPKFFLKGNTGCGSDFVFCQQWHGEDDVHKETRCGSYADPTTVNLIQKATWTDSFQVLCGFKSDNSDNRDGFLGIASYVHCMDVLDNVA